MQKGDGKGSDTAAILTGPLTDWAEYGSFYSETKEISGSGAVCRLQGE